MKKIIALALVLCMVLSMVPAAFAAEAAVADFAVVNPTVDYQENPVGLTAEDVKFSWAMVSEAYGASQLNYQIVVREGSEDGPVVWDTGIVDDGASTAVYYGGAELKKAVTYYWTVTVTAQDGNVAASDVATFELADDITDATWISFGQNDQPAPLFRKEFAVEKEVASARLYMTALGIYEAYINGEEVRLDDVDDIFNPGAGDYTESVAYQTYDVTDLVVAGQNAIGVAVGGGWYQTSYNSNFQSLYGPNNRAEERALLGKVVVTYTDGTKLVVPTDTTWQVSQDSPYQYDDMWNGETYDARIAARIEGWNKVGYDTEGWTAPAAIPYDREVLADARATAYINENFEQAPISGYTYNDAETTEAGWSTDREGVWWRGAVVEHPVKVDEDIVLTAGDKLVLDMGQNMVGFTNVTITGAADTEVTIRHAEFLNDGYDPDFNPETGRNGNTGSDAPKGVPYYTSLRSAKATDKLTLTGAGKEVWQPRFTFHGFRYVEITATADITLHDLRGLVVSSVGEEIGELETSDQYVNQLISNTKWSQMGNYLSIPTDCPQRNERAGWTGDAQLFAQTAVMNFDVNTFLERYIALMSEYAGKNGLYADVMPKTGTTRQPNCGWSDAGIIIPWVMYLQTGDTSIIELGWNEMDTYAELVYANGYNTRTYGDWLAPWPCSMPCMNMIYECYIHTLMAEMADQIGRPDDVEKYLTYADEVRQDFIAKYIDEEGNLLSATADLQANGSLPVVGLFPAMTCMDNAQTALLWALKLGLYDSEETRQTFIENLLINIRNEGQSIRPDGAENSLSVGFLGVNVLLPVLTDVGEAETAYTLLLQDQNPSWLYSVKNGATTIWERWDAYSIENSFATASMNSFNHYSYGAALEWIYNYGSGIMRDETPAGVGYKHFILQPTVDPAGRIDYINGSYGSLYGEIVSNWTSENGELAAYDVVIPANTSATMYLPVAGKDILVSDDLAAYVDVIGEVEYNGETVVQLEVLSGAYSFVATEAGIEVTADGEFVKSGVEVSLTGVEAATVDAEELVYSLTAGAAINLATVSVTVDLDGLDADVIAADGWQVLATTEEDGKLTALLINLKGLTTDEAVEIAKIVAATPEVGTYTVALEDVTLSAYVGETEAYIDAVIGSASVETFVDYSIYDVNEDGVVDQLDITRAQRYFGAADETCDVDNSGLVDIADLILILNHYTA